jgi:hypothetical protein
MDQVPERDGHMRVVAPFGFRERAGLKRENQALDLVDRAVGGFSAVARHPHSFNHDLLSFPVAPIYSTSGITEGTAKTDLPSGRRLPLRLLVGSGFAPKVSLMFSLRFWERETAPAESM